MSRRRQRTDRFADHRYFKLPWIIGIQVTLEDLRFLLVIAKTLKRPMTLEMAVDLLAHRKFE